MRKFIGFDGQFRANAINLLQILLSVAVILNAEHGNYS